MICNLCISWHPMDPRPPLVTPWSTMLTKRPPRCPLDFEKVTTLNSLLCCSWTLGIAKFAPQGWSIIIHASFHPHAKDGSSFVASESHGDESKVGYYVGLLLSVSFATQAVTVLYWSSISDRVGRKPVILTGVFGVSLSMYCFGLSKRFWALVVR